MHHNLTRLVFRICPDIAKVYLLFTPKQLIRLINRIEHIKLGGYKERFRLLDIMLNVCSIAVCRVKDWNAL